MVLKLKFKVFDILMIMGLLLLIYFKSIFFYFLIDAGADVINSRDKVKPDQPYWFPTAVGLGSLIYLTHWCFGEVSLVTRWVVTGFPDHGPTPYYGGYCSFIYRKYCLLIHGLLLVLRDLKYVKELPLYFDQSQNVSCQTSLIFKEAEWSTN